MPKYADTYGRCDGDGVYEQFSVGLSGERYSLLWADDYASDSDRNCQHEVHGMRLTNSRGWRRLEQGGVATIVAVIFGGGVALGGAAISIDVGNLMWERRQLQNAADAAALSLAQSCAEGACAPSANGLDALRDANAVDGKHGYGTTSSMAAGQCGRGAVGLPACGSTGVTSDLGQCPELPVGLNGTVPYVEVHTKTVSNTSTLRQMFAGAIGASSDNIVAACARAAYGAIGAASFPVTISMCEWKTNTSNGTNYYPYNPPYGSPPNSPLPPSSKEVTLWLQDHGAHNQCLNFNGHDTAGGFGYIDAVGCSATIHPGDWVQVDTGSSAPGGCNLAPFYQKVVALPIYSCVARYVGGPPPSTWYPATGGCNYGTGSNTWYKVESWAKFYISGYKISGSNQQPSAVTGTVPCSGGDRCISGWFLDGVLNDISTFPSGPIPLNNFGAYQVTLAG